MVAIGRYDELARAVLTRPGPVRLVGIDGYGAAGKTTFASRLARAAGGAPIVHTDDFASHDVPMDWWPRMLADVIEPLLNGQPATYTAYDWVNRADGPTVTVEPRPLVIIEGVGATRDAWRDRLAMSIWIDTPPAERSRRALARDGEALAEFWQEWRVAEDAYVAAEKPQENVAVLVDGAAGRECDADNEYVIVRARVAVRLPRHREPG
jgi:uridine kinase